MFLFILVGLTSQLLSGFKLLWSGNFNDGWEDSWGYIEHFYGQENTKTMADPYGIFSDDVLQVTYPANTYASDSGAGFLSRPLYDTNSNGYDTLCLQYNVAFDKNFQWVLGGKLPGQFGDLGPDSENTTCRGGVQPDGTNCFSTRQMWRPYGGGEMYGYVLHPTEGDSICTNEAEPEYPKSDIYCSIVCNSNDGQSIGRDMYYYRINEYNQITQQITLNDPNNLDGVMKIWLNGVKVSEYDSIQFRTVDTLKISGVEFSTFFGGGTSSYATPVTTHAWFANFSLYDRCDDYYSDYNCDYNCNDNGKCTNEQSCNCNSNNINSYLCDCVNCPSSDIEFNTVIQKCWGEGWILALQIINNNNNKIESIDFTMEFQIPVNITLEGSWYQNFKMLNSSTYSMTSIRSVNAGQTYEFPAVKVYPQTNPQLIVQNVNFE